VASESAKLAFCWNVVGANMCTCVPVGALGIWSVFPFCVIPGRLSVRDSLLSGQKSGGETMDKR